MRKLLAFIVIGLMLGLHASAQLSFDHLTVAGGLSQSTVLSICRDSRGYMWFGTRDRLNRYDAHVVKIFNHDYRDTGSISCSDYVFAVMEDRSHNLWVGTVKGLNRYIPENNTFRHYMRNAKDPYSISDNNIYALYQDSYGQIWVGTGDGLNMLSSPDANAFTHFVKSSKDKPGLTDNQVYAIYEDHLHQLWVGGTDGLTKIVRQNGSYVFTNFYTNTQQPNGLHGNTVRTITEDKNHLLWIGTETAGINVFDPANQSFTHLKHEQGNNNSLSNNDVRKIMPDNKGRLWVGTINGLNIVDPDTRIFTHYEHDAENRNSLSDNSIKDIYQDRSGSIWVGTNYGGVNVVHPDNIPFHIFQYNKFKNSISGNIVSAMIAGPQNSLWIGTEGYGLNRFDTLSKTFSQYKNIAADKTSLSTNFVKTVYRDRQNNLWIGLHQGGLELMQGNGFKHYRHNAQNPLSISSDIVLSLLEDTRGRFWVGTSQGLDLFDRQAQTFRNYFNNAAQPFNLTRNAVRCIYEDSKHNLWVGTTGGLNMLPSGSEKFKWFLPNEKKADSLRVGYINCIREDDSGNVWIGSFHGRLSLYLPGKQAFKTFGIAEGLPSDNVLNIQQGDAQSLWLSTDNGLALFDLITHKVRTFTVKDGLPTNEFNYNSSFKDAAGTLYFGTYAGLVSFSPKQISRNVAVPAIEFTGLKLFNKPVQIGDESGLLQKDISLTDKIIFHHDQNVFSVDFTALNFDKPDRNRFMYKLDGFETEWNNVNIPTGTYTNLPAGDYDLLVRVGNRDGVWSRNTKKLHIQVLPPLWQTWWAYLLYSVIFVFTLYLIIRFFRRQARLERDLYYEHLNYERQQEIYQLKLDFFTKISHEIRTPLSLILAPVEKLLSNVTGDTPISRNLTYVKQHADRLMRLVDELLDFRKVESGHMKLSVAGHDLVAFCESISLSFSQLASSRHITYQFTHTEEQLVLWFDAGQLEKVLYNIIGNAFKFTPDGGQITISVKADAVGASISITDNGVGIAAEAQRHIFENFYQDKRSSSAPGWGIGLALAKNIVELHQGSISVNSKEAQGDAAGTTTFSIKLQAGTQHFIADQLLDSTAFLLKEPLVLSSAVNEDDSDTSAIKAEKPVILLVEDNTEVRAFIKETLGHEYTLYESANGQEGCERAIELIPDLIISDVAMPVMDGFELCARIKTDERTDHIPVILLTARADQANHLDGLKQGADIYLTKPFSVQVLELHIRNLLTARQAMRRKYAQQVTLLPAGKMIDSPDEQFLAKVTNIICERMENPDFDVPMLVDEIGMSQTVLYRKLKALTGLTIVDFIKTTRLKQAAAMLAQNKLGVAEVAYAVGFNDRKYFSKEFKKQFGQSPTDFAAREITPAG